MKSPFPGMDPFIEVCGLWEDFHHALIEDIKNALTALAPARYTVRTGERAYVVLANAEGKESYPFRPDVGITTTPASEHSSPGPVAALADTTTASGPVDMRAFVEEEFKEGFVEIYDSDSQRKLVTCIEVLSPSNKRRGSTGWNLYLRKRQGLLLGEANLVEIDLLRGGDRLPMLDPWPASPYTLLVSRQSQPSRCRVWPAFVLRRLPTLPVPLLKPDPDLPLGLQPMIDSIYERSRYCRSIDYSKPLNPRLAPDETAWLQQQSTPPNSA